MGTEVEKKFLIEPPTDEYRQVAHNTLHIQQGILRGSDGKHLTRVRVVNQDLDGHMVASAYLTVKGPQKAITRMEFEYPIPLEDAEIMLSTLCVDHVHKVRYQMPIQTYLPLGGGGKMQFFQRTLEVDVFMGDNAGLILAEVEMEYEEELIQWEGLGFDLGVQQDVSQDHRYSNSNLGKNPWKNWRPTPVIKVNTVEEAANHFLSILSEEDFLALIEGSDEPSDFMQMQALIHMGRWMRNNYGLWKGHEALKKDSGKEHPDDISGVILDRAIEIIRERAAKELEDQKE